VIMKAMSALSPGKKTKKETVEALPARSPDGAAASAAADPAMVDLSAGVAAVSSSSPTAGPQNELRCQPDFASVDGKPKAGFTTANAPDLQMFDGDGTEFSLRSPGYKKHGQKVSSVEHMSRRVTIDIFKRKKLAVHVASKLTLPPPPDGAAPNTSGLPRRLVCNCILPSDAPSILGGGTDGNCFQIVIVFGATSEALTRWKASATPAYRLFERFSSNAPEGVNPESGDIDVKERVKLLPRVDNLDKLGLPGWLVGYNGKPALCTKSGAVFRGDDYLEIGMNLFRFGYLAKKALNYVVPRIGDFHFHSALTLEGRDDEELPEQTLLAARIVGADLEKYGSEYEL